MSRYAVLGGLQGLNAGLHTGMAIQQQRTNNERTARLDQENSDHMQWQRGRADQQDKLALELQDMQRTRFEREGLEYDDATRTRDMKRAYQIYSTMTTNEKGERVPLDMQDQRLVSLINETPEIRDLLAAGEKVDDSMPFAGFLPVSEVTGDPNDTRYSAMLRRYDGNAGPLTEGRSDDPRDSAATFTPEELQNIIESMFAPYGEGERRAGLQERQQGREDYTWQLGQQSDAAVSQAQRLSQLGIGKDGKRIGTEGFKNLPTDLANVFKDMDGTVDEEYYSAFNMFRIQNGYNDPYVAYAAFIQLENGGATPPPGGGTVTPPGGTQTKQAGLRQQAEADPQKTQAFAQKIAQTLQSGPKAPNAIRITLQKEAEAMGIPQQLAESMIEQATAPMKRENRAQQFGGGGGYR